MRIAVRYKVGITISAETAAATVGTSRHANVAPEILITHDHFQHSQGACVSVAFFLKVSAAGHILYLGRSQEALIFPGCFQTADICKTALFCITRKMICQMFYTGFQTLQAIRAAGIAEHKPAFFQNL